MIKKLFPIILFLALIQVVTGQCQWDRFKAATDETTTSGKELGDAIDEDFSLIDVWEEMDKAGIRNIDKGLVDAWKKLDNLGADEALRRNTDALEYLSNGRSDKILLDVEELLGGHSKARHGSNLSLSEMEQRVLGTHPTMGQSRSALKFDSDAIHEDAVNKAFAHHKSTIESHFSSSTDYLELDFDYRSKIGEGFTNTATRSNPVSLQVDSDVVRIAFKADINSPGGFILDSAYPFYQ